MAALDPSLRSALEKAVVEARDEAERAAQAALSTLAVDLPQAFSTLSVEQRELRNALRAKARQLGMGNQVAGLPILIEEVAYEQWHRMLFARFLAESDLLMHPTGVAVTLEDCEELASEEGDSDRWMTAARYASRMLPGIFHPDDPSVRVSLAPEGRAALETILADLPNAVFTSDDSLGWVYQFWQSKKKKEVSSSGQKIEKLDLAAYSQLFTEDYMVRFLLENSLGAWWAARHPKSPLLKEFAYLRFRDDGTPAAETFPGWPEPAAGVTVMDPCCGSGHFLVVAFDMLRRMRMEEEGLTAADAADAVLRDNLFGLEIDPRCVQIAAFALALAAWKVGGYRALPLPNIACSGIPVAGQLDGWNKLAGDDVNMQNTLERLYGLFVTAPDLGSLINPADVPVRERMFAPDFSNIAPVLEKALAKEVTEDPVATVFGQAARGVARAGELLSRRYTLVATNVPFLKGGDQGDVLRRFCNEWYPESRINLATVFLERCRAFVMPGCTYATVTPENIRFLRGHYRLRTRLLREQRFEIFASLGTKAFQTPMWDFGVWLLILTDAVANGAHTMAGIDASAPKTIDEKRGTLRTGAPNYTTQAEQLSNPDARITMIPTVSHELLEEYAHSYKGINTGDDPRFRRRFWELPQVPTGWRYLQSSVSSTRDFGGCEAIVWYDQLLTDSVSGATIRGEHTWNERGVMVSQMGNLPCTLSVGVLFDQNAGVLLPTKDEYLAPIWAFCKSLNFNESVRRIDSALKVTNATLVKIPFDLEHWQRVAQQIEPLPEPNSSDPTQWLFLGSPAGTTDPLQVVTARLLGYEWPQQGHDGLSPLAVPDGILSQSAATGQLPAAEQLRSMLAAAFGDDFSAIRETQLLRQVGFDGKGLDVWLRDGFFEQHCKLFHQRPFIWHIWDGRKDGFSALVNYHMFDATRLDKLIYTFLGDWIRTQRAARDAGTAGADARLVAALELQKKLEAIRDGEPPYDIYVRWKPPEQQSVGWNPDVNDGVRLNIRPFVTAGVLRNRMNVNWKKDRGLNPDGSERINDRHLTLAEKRAGREAALT